MPAATVLLARHATPDWNRRDIPYDIPPGPPLTAQGEAEAEKLGHHLLAQGARRIYASPLVRTLRTAEIAARICGASLAVAHEIAEWRRDEDEPKVLERTRAFWLRAVHESRERGPVTLVTHGGCVMAMLHWLGVPQGEMLHYRNQFDHRNPLPPAGVWLTQEAPAAPPATEPAGHLRGPVADIGTLHAALHPETPTPSPLWEVRFAFAPVPMQPFVPQLAVV